MSEITPERGEGAPLAPTPGAWEVPVFRFILLILAATLCFDLMEVMPRFLLARYPAPEFVACGDVIGPVPSLALMPWTGELRPKGMAREADAETVARSGGAG